MKHIHFDVESDGFYGAYWACRQYIFKVVDSSFDIFTPHITLLYYSLKRYGSIFQAI